MVDMIKPFSLVKQKNTIVDHWTPTSALTFDRKCKSIGALSD